MRTSSCSARVLPLRARTATNPGHAAISAGRYRVLSRLLPRATARYRVRYRVLPRSLPRATAFAIACYFLATACYFFVAPATAFYRVLPRATALSAAVLLREAKKNGSYRVLSVLPGSTGFYRVLSCTTACYKKNRVRSILPRATQKNRVRSILPRKTGKTGKDEETRFYPYYRFYFFWGGSPDAPGPSEAGRRSASAPRVEPRALELHAAVKFPSKI